MSGTSFAAVGLSADDTGYPILITGTSTGSPTTIHVSTSTTNETDEIYLEAANVGTTEETISIQVYDGTSSRQILYPITVGPNLGPIRLIDGMRFNDGRTIEAFVSSSGAFVVWGTVNRITTQ